MFVFISRLNEVLEDIRQGKASVGLRTVGDKCDLFLPWIFLLGSDARTPVKEKALDGDIEIWRNKKQQQANNSSGLLLMHGLFFCRSSCFQLLVMSRYAKKWFPQ